MAPAQDTWMILEKLDKMSAEHRDEIHALETRTDNKITTLRTDFLDLKRDTREDIKEIKGAVNQVKDSNRHIVIAIVLGSVGIGITVVLSVVYGSWTILGTLKAFMPVIK